MFLYIHVVFIIYESILFVLVFVKRDKSQQRVLICLCLKMLRFLNHVKEYQILSFPLNYDLRYHKKMVSVSYNCLYFSRAILFSLYE